MKRLSAVFLLSLSILPSFAQENQHTLLWKISGKDLVKPSYLFGTIHMLCREDAVLSDNLLNALQETDEVYLELDLDNMFEMLSVLSKMKMKNDTTLADLLTPEEYQITKDYFEKNVSMLPFSILETYKPLLASSILMESGIGCEEQVAMESLIMEEAKKKGKQIEGLETMAYQMSVFDSIPYQLQAKELYKGIAGTENKESNSEDEFKKMMRAYKEQDLEQLSNLMLKSEEGMMQYDDMLLYNRNRNWVEKLTGLLHKKSLFIAVGAGHLPGEKGVIELLRKQGYQVSPVQNKKSSTREL